MLEHIDMKRKLRDDSRGRPQIPSLTSLGLVKMFVTLRKPMQSPTATHSSVFGTCKNVLVFRPLQDHYFMECIHSCREKFSQTNPACSLTSTVFLFKILK